MLELGLMADMPKFSNQVWNKIKDHQIEKLNKMEVVSNLRSRYIDDFAPYRMYLLKSNMSKDNYDVKGYEYITFTLNCPAVVGFSNAVYGFKPSAEGVKGLGQPTKIHENGVYVATEHQMEIYLPRNFNADPIGWGIRFIKDPPMYPNIMCAHHDNNNQLMLNFSGLTHQLEGAEAGMVCIGSASSFQRPVDAASLIADLVRSLKILDDNRYVGLNAGGVNDEGFEKPLWEHYVMNLQTIKNALTSPVKPKPKKKKLGQTVQERTKKKLGKKANER